MLHRGALPEAGLRNGHVVLCAHPNNSDGCRTRALREAGFDVIEAGNGLDAVNLALEQRPALILFDELLPDWQILEACKQLKSHQQTRTIPVLGVSSDTDAERVMPQRLDHLFDAYFHEPLDPAALVATVTALIQAREAERRRLQGDLVSSERRLDRILDIDAFAVIFFDSTGTVIDASETFLRMTGYTRAEIERRELTWRRLTPEEWVPVSEEQLQKLAATGRIGPYEKEYFLADGSRRWMLFAGRDLGDGTMAEHCFDISKRKEAEAQLLAAKERLAADLAGMTCLYSLNQKLTHADSLEASLDAILGAAIDFTGTDRGNVQLVAKDGGLSIAVQRGHRPAFLKHFGLSSCPATCDTALRSRERVIVADVKADPRLSGTRDLEVMLDEGVRAVQSTPLVARDGRALGVLSTHFTRPHRPSDAELRMLDLLASLASDFVARAQAEVALRESEQRFRALVTASSEVLYRMSPDWSEMRQLSGGGFLADTEQSNRSWLQEYILSDDQPFVTAAIKEAIRRKSNFELEHRVRLADGSVGWTLSRAVPIQNARGEILEWFGAASDVTARRQAEDARIRSEARLAATLHSIPDEVWILDAPATSSWSPKPCARISVSRPTGGPISAP